MTTNKPDAIVELLPCPFCGGEPDFKEGVYTQYIICMKCDAMSLSSKNARKVVEAWNTRTTLKQPATIDEAVVRKCAEAVFWTRHNHHLKDDDEAIARAVLTAAGFKMEDTHDNT